MTIVKENLLVCNRLNVNFVQSGYIKLTSHDRNVLFLSLSFRWVLDHPIVYLFRQNEFKFFFYHLSPIRVHIIIRLPRVSVSRVT